MPIGNKYNIMPDTKDSDFFQKAAQLYFFINEIFQINIKRILYPKLKHFWITFSQSLRFCFCSAPCNSDWNYTFLTTDIVVINNELDNGFKSNMGQQF